VEAIDGLRSVDVRVPCAPGRDPRTLCRAQAYVMRVRAVLVALFAVALSAGAWWFRARAHRDAEARAAVGGERVVPVRTATVEKRDVPIWLEGLGNVAGFYTVTVKSQVDGRIERVLFNEGQHVRAGDALVQIDPRPFTIQLRQAEAALERDRAQAKNAELTLGRDKALRAQGLTSDQQVSDQEALVSQITAQVHADEAQVESAKLMLDYSRVTSPIDGVTGVRLVDPGNVVRATDTTGFVVVTQLDPIAVNFTLPEDDLTALKDARAMRPALPVEAFSRDGSTRLGEGTLSVVDNQINQATATLRLKATFKNPKQSLWPNQFVKARIELAVRKDAIVVPAAVIQRGPQGTFAYVVERGDAASVRPVDVATIQGDLAIVASGLKSGESVIVDGQAQLRPGSRVSAKSASSVASRQPEPSP
jgi:multidrug efflux system membrane fusion protein